MQMDLNIYDGREYFEKYESALNTARYNEFGIYVGSYDTVSGEYANVRLYSTISFNNRDLSMKTKSSYLYRLYSLI